MECGSALAFSEREGTLVEGARRKGRSQRDSIHLEERHSAASHASGVSISHTVPIEVQFHEIVNNLVLFLSSIVSWVRAHHTLEKNLPLKRFQQSYGDFFRNNSHSDLKHSCVQKKDPRIPSLLIQSGMRMESRFTLRPRNARDRSIMENILVTRRAFELRWRVAISAF